MIRIGGSARALACALVLAGCATPRPDADIAGPVLAGRLSVRVDAEPPRAASAAFELRGDARRGAMLLTSPLGATLARASWSPEGTLLDVPGSRTRYDDLDDLAEHALGERLPMAALFDWLRGRPWPGAPSKELSAGSAGFEQLGWQIKLERFDQGFVEAQRASPPPVTVRARIEEPAP